MAQVDLPSLDVVLEEVRRRLDFQFGQLDALVTKAGIVIGVAGIICTLLVTHILSKSSTAANLVISQVALIPIFVSLVLSFVAMHIMKWRRPPNLTRLRDYYVVKDTETTKLNIVDECLKAVDSNQKLIDKLFSLVKCSYVFLLTGLVLLAVWIVVVIWQGGNS